MAVDKPAATAMLRVRTLVDDFQMVDCSGKLGTLGTSECKELEGSASCMMNFGRGGEVAMAM